MGVMKKWIYIFVASVAMGILGFLQHYISTYGLRPEFKAKTGYPPSILTVESIIQGIAIAIITIIILYLVQWWRFKKINKIKDTIS